jgi:hypothetical protein
VDNLESLPSVTRGGFAVEVIRQIVKVPPSRELSIKLPEDIATDEQVEVIVRFESTRSLNAEKMTAMELAMRDELFVSDLRETMADFEYADLEAEIA